MYLIVQVEGGPAALLSQQAAALDATGVGSMANSMWMNGARLPDHSRLASPQAKMGYGLQVEMQRLQVPTPDAFASYCAAISQIKCRQLPEKSKH